jgi:hypothetical protein
MNPSQHRGRTIDGQQDSELEPWSLPLTCDPYLLRDAAPIVARFQGAAWSARKAPKTPLQERRLGSECVFSGRFRRGQREASVRLLRDGSRCGQDEPGPVDDLLTVRRNGKWPVGREGVHMGVKLVAVDRIHISRAASAGGCLPEAGRGVICSRAVSVTRRTLFTVFSNASTANGFASVAAS